MPRLFVWLACLLAGLWVGRIASLASLFAAWEPTRLPCSRQGNHTPVERLKGKKKHGRVAGDGTRPPQTHPVLYSYTIKIGGAGRRLSLPREVPGPLPSRFLVESLAAA